MFKVRSHIRYWIEQIALYLCLILRIIIKGVLPESVGNTVTTRVASPSPSLVDAETQNW